MLRWYDNDGYGCQSDWEKDCKFYLKSEVDPLIKSTMNAFEKISDIEMNVPAAKMVAKILTKALSDLNDALSEDTP